MDFRQDYDRITVIPFSCHSSNPTLSGTTIAYSILSILLVYYIFNHLNYTIVSFPKILWDIVVYLIPDSLVRALDKHLVAQTQYKGDDTMDSPGLFFSAKSQAVQRILGLVTGQLGGIPVVRSLSITGIAPKAPRGTRLPGLGNWDNSCYQNSIIQGLASLPALHDFLDQATSGAEYSARQTTVQALRSIIVKLNDPSNANKLLWTPEKLKNMSSLQQQDAQEYYSKILNEMEKETLCVASQNPEDIGLLGIRNLNLDSSTDIVQIPKAGPESRIYFTEKHQNFLQPPAGLISNSLKSPLEGLLAQRVGCLQCGFVEGLSMIPFNCLTLPLGKEWTYDIRSCLDEYTALESIVGVDCSKCTLLRQKKQLEKLMNNSRAGSKGMESSIAPPPSNRIRELAIIRLKAVMRALEEDDYSENTLLKKCLIPPKSRISTTKTRQAVISRHPKSLVMHVNRSVFDELTGESRKSHAEVQFPEKLDLSPWCLGNLPPSNASSFDFIPWTTDPSKSMIPGDYFGQNEDQPGSTPVVYSLKAVVTHYGRHENGHYVCYRKRPRPQKNNGELKDMDQWWCLSDDDVSEVTEDDVLAQGGVFMLFYELDEGCGKDFSANIKPANPMLSIDDPVGNRTISEKVELAIPKSAIESPPTQSNTDGEERAGHDTVFTDPTLSPALVAPRLPSLSPAVKQCVDNKELSPHNSIEGSHILGQSGRIEGIYEGSSTKNIPSSAQAIETVENLHITGSVGPSDASSDKPTSKEDRQLTPRMRTAGSWNSKDNGNRAGRAMSVVSSMVAAN